MKSLKSLIFVFVFTCWNAEAAVVTWTLKNVSLSGSGQIGSANGSFDFDAATDTFSNINISAAETYGSISFLNGDASFLELSSGRPSFLNMSFDSALTESGGTIGVAVEETIILFTSPIPITAFLSGSGFVTGTPAVPIPAAAWLFGSGLLGLIGIARRKKV